MEYLWKHGCVSCWAVARCKPKWWRQWFFSKDSRFGDYARIASTPARETYNGVDVVHPRYFLPPKVGMNLAPVLLALGAKPAIQRLLDEGFDFDVIDAHYYYPDGVAAALLAKHFRPFTVTARYMTSICPIRPP